MHFRGKNWYAEGENDEKKHMQSSSTSYGYLQR